MSRDGRYILSYEHQSYTKPTPMQHDINLILTEHKGLEIKMLDSGFTIHFELPKYTLSQDTISKLKADKVFEAVDGDCYETL